MRIVVRLVVLAVIAWMPLQAFGQQEYASLPTSEEIFGWIKDLTSFGYRRTGTEAALKGERYIETKFREFGLEQVRLEPIEVETWHREKWSFQIQRDGEWRSIPCFPVPFSHFTDPEGIQADAVYVGEGTEEAYARTGVKGRIVLFDVRFVPVVADHLRTGAHFFYDPRNTIPEGYSYPGTWMSPQRERVYQMAVEEGAAGLVGILMDMPANKYTLYAPYPNPQEVSQPLPMVYVGRDDGQSLREVLERGIAKAHLTYSGHIEPGVTHNVVGVLPGKTDEAILISSHHDSPFAGAVEDGSGISMVLALAKYFSGTPAGQRDKTLWFVATAGHHYGSIGINTFVRQHADDLNPKLLCAIHLEHVGKHFVERNGQLVDTGLAEPAAIFVSDVPLLITAAKEALIRHNLERVFILPAAAGVGPRPNPHGESGAYFSAGVPVAGLISGPVYLLFEDDTLDKVAVDRLRPTAAVFADIVVRLDEAPREQIRPRAESGDS